MKHLRTLTFLVVAAILAFAGVDKLLHYEGFVNALRSYVLLPRGMAPILAPAVIAAELLVAVALFVRPWRSAAALAGAGLFVLFTTALAFNHLLGGRGICGCWFTVTLAQGTGMHVAQNLTLAALCLITWWDGRSASALSGTVTSATLPQPNTT
jgi:uncharacterized membrane protein